MNVLGGGPEGDDSTIPPWVLVHSGDRPDETGLLVDLEAVHQRAVFRYDLGREAGRFLLQRAEFEVRVSDPGY